MSRDDDNYALSITQTAVAQIVYAQAERQSHVRQVTRPGVKTPHPVSPSTVHVTKTVMDSLSDIVTAFIEQIGRAANSRTELTGRTKSNLIDVLYALETLSSISRSTPNDLAKYAMHQRIPFPFTVPPFPVAAPSRKPPRELYIETDDKRERSYIESWMPPLPSSHTYVSTAVTVNPKGKRKAPEEMREQRRSVEKSLAKLKEAQSGADREEGLMAAAAAAVPENPFLAPPKVGAGRLFDEDVAGDARDITEPATDHPDDAYDTNLNMVDMPKGAIHEQKRMRVERVLKQGGRSEAQVATSGPRP